MGLFARMMRRLGAEAQEKAQEPAVEEPVVEEEETAAPEATDEETALLGRVTRLRVAAQETLAQSFLTTRIYTFTAPFDRKDMIDLVEALRFLGFRLLALGVEVDGEELPCEGLIGFKRAVEETEVEITGVTAAGSYAGSRVSCHIAAEGRLQISYDTLRPISLEPFEELFVPEE